ncbi:MAG: hypothetical protein ACE5E0_01470 [Terriglobia bacterium]
MEWEHNGIVVQEGLRPGEPAKDKIQYFFLALKDDDKLFKYCVWLDRNSQVRKEHPGTDEELATFLRGKAKDKVVAKIDESDYRDICLIVNDKGDEEVLLEDLDEKLE